MLGDVFGGRKAKQRSGRAERKAGVFMLHRCHSPKRALPCGLKMKQADPALPKAPFALPFKPTSPHSLSCYSLGKKILTVFRGLQRNLMLSGFSVFVIILLLLLLC